MIFIDIRASEILYSQQETTNTNPILSFSSILKSINALIALIQSTISWAVGKRSISSTKTTILFIEGFSFLYFGSRSFKNAS